MARAIDISTPLDKDVLLFHKMYAKEELGRLSECDLHLLSEDQAINLDEVLGKTVTVSIRRPDDTLRYYNGYVTRISQVGRHGRYHAYRATVRPWLWFLTRTTNCRIFQKKNVPDIIKEIFGHHSGIVDVQFERSRQLQEFRQRSEKVYFQHPELSVLYWTDDAYRAFHLQQLKKAKIQ